MLLENILITKVALIITGDDHLCNNPLVSCMYLHLFALKYLLNTLVSYIYIYTHAMSAFNVCMTCIVIGIQTFILAVQQSCLQNCLESLEQKLQNF